MELKGGKITLRDKAPEDAWKDYVWRSDEEISKLDAAYPLKMKFEEFLRLYKDQLRYPTPASRRLSIDTLDGKFIGNCMYYDLDTINRQAEIGIVIGDKEYWNNGYGYDALVTMLDYMFSHTDVRRLYLHTLDWNKRAKRAFEKCGFTPVKPVRRNALDFIRMELAKDHWMATREDKLAIRDANPGAPQT